MANQPYFPKRDGDQLTWFTNLQTKIPSYYTQLDISTARQAKLTLVLNWLVWAWQSFIPTRRQDATAATAWRNNLAFGTSDASTNTAPPSPGALTPPAGTPFYGMLTWLLEEVARWKKAEGYTDTIGQDLGIVGAGPQAHTDPPQLDGEMIGQNNVELTFTLWEHDGVFIQSRRQGEADFSFLATDSSSPYNDTRPVTNAGQAEWREYRACWYDDDKPSMQFGPVIRVVLQG